MESFNGKLRDELLNRELFLGLAESRCVVDEWRLDYNHHRPHSSLDWQTSAAFYAKLNEREDQAVGVFSTASLADPPVGAAPLPLDLLAQSTPILSQRLVQKPEGALLSSQDWTNHGRKLGQS